MNIELEAWEIALIAEELSRALELAALTSTTSDEYTSLNELFIKFAEHI